MMIQDKQNILKSFQGRKIDQSVHVKRWGTITNQSPQDSNRLIFNKYAMGQGDSRQQSGSQEHMFATQESQVHEIDTGFKKLKNNQIQKLKELKQEYQVLRNLNIEQKPSSHNLHPKVHSQSSSLHQSPSQQLLSSSSRHNPKKSHTRNNQNLSRQAQILALQKKQLQMVINNSMRKIQQLLHNQMQYKKQIHQLKLQVSGRQNVDVEYEQMIRTLKKGEMNLVENNEALKKQNQKNKFQIRQLNEKIQGLESELTMKDQEIRLLLGQKRKSQDLIRLQKDRYFNLDIDYKKTKMQYQLLQKDKTNQINRLMKQLDFSSPNKTRDLQLKLKRYQDDISIKDKRYHVLMTQLQDLKMRYNILQQQYFQYRSNYTVGQFDKDKIQEILINFREQNDSVVFGRQMNQVINKLQQVDHYQNDHLRQQIQMLKMQLQGFRQNQKQQSQSSTIQQYLQKIQQLQKMIRQQSQQKDQLLAKMKRFQREFEEISRRLHQSQKDLQTNQQVQGKLRQEIRTLKEEVRGLRVRVQSVQTIKPTQPVIDNRVNKQLQLSMKQSAKYKQQLQQVQNQLRSTKRLADENQFRVTKTATQLEFRLKMQQTQHNALHARMVEDMDRQRKDFMKIKQEYEQYRLGMERRLQEKQQEVDNLKAKLRLSSQSTQTSTNNLKHQYQSLLKSQRERYKLQLQQLSTQVTSLSKINQKYLQQSAKYVHYENQLACLRQIMRRSIHLSEGVDHLWRIKQTEYQNANQLLRQILDGRH